MRKVEGGKAKRKPKDDGLPQGFVDDGPGPWQTLTCRGCGEDVEETEIVGGALRLPSGWRWHTTRTNREPGTKTVRIG